MNFSFTLSGSITDPSVLCLTDGEINVSECVRLLLDPSHINGMEIEDTSCELMYASGQ